MRQIHLRPGHIFCCFLSTTI